MNEAEIRMKMLEEAPSEMEGVYQLGRKDQAHTHRVKELEDAGLYPRSLVRAHTDEWAFVLRLRSGETIQFQSAEIEGEFVHLNFPCKPDTGSSHALYGGNRGVDVRISEIVWCYDCDS